MKPLTALDLPRRKGMRRRIVREYSMLYQQETFAVILCLHLLVWGNRGMVWGSSGYRRMHARKHKTPRGGECSYVVKIQS